MSIGGIVLAAGASRRLGRPKQLLPFRGTTLLACSTGAMVGLGLDPLVVVLGFDAARIASEARLPDDPVLRVVVNAAWEQGQSSSLRRGIEACAGCEAVLVTLGYLPTLRPEVARRVLTAWDGRAPAVAAIHDGRWQHPVLFARRVYGEILALRGDVGGRAVLDAHAAEVVRVPGEPLPDVDTAEDHRSLLGE